MSKIAKAVLQLTSAVLIPACAIGFVVTERAGALDHYFGYDSVLDVAARLETSYAENVDRQIGADERAWRPLLRLIRKYSTARLPSSREPVMLARSVAVASAKASIGPGEIAEWTAPSTPIILIYADWPGHAAPPNDYRVVGTIGDLRVWVERSRSDIRFWFQDFSIALFSLAIGGILLASDLTDSWSAVLGVIRRGVRHGKQEK